jgi:hypothetical protein
MNDTDERSELAERVSRSVAHALALVGPAENGAERLSDDETGEATIS